MGGVVGVDVEVVPDEAVPLGVMALSSFGVGLAVVSLAANGEEVAVGDPPFGRGWLTSGVTPLAETGVPSRA